MYSGTDHRGWNKFWNSRKKELSSTQFEPFFNNFDVMKSIINSSCVGWFEHQTMSVLEVGAGRGTMSELFNRDGNKTFSTDIEDRTKYPKFPNGTVFIKNDILENKPFADKQFDVVFTYGLLEHFNPFSRRVIIDRCLEMTNQGGLSMHYVVPSKLTNICEDRSVHRDKCREITDNFNYEQYSVTNGGIKFVYPAWGNGWECSSIRSKGFIMWLRKFSGELQYESISIGNCQVN